jgi:hypothetical protein
VGDATGSVGIDSSYCCSNSGVETGSDSGSCCGCAFGSAADQSAISVSAEEPEAEEVFGLRERFFNDSDKVPSPKAAVLGAPPLVGM